MQSIKSPFLSEHEGTQSTAQEVTAIKTAFCLNSQEKKAMTFKSLNTRYVKLIRKTAVMGVGLLVIVSLLALTRWCAEASGFNRRPAEADNSIPALKGAAAITYLKEHKLDDSLTAALNAAHIQRGAYSIVAPLFVNEQTLTASDGEVGDAFGHSVAFSGSTVVVGAWFDDIGGNPNQGSAYVFKRQGGAWVEAQKLTASDGTAGDNFGLSVAVSGSTIVVGAWLDDIGGNPDQGSAYVFNLQDGHWVETQKLTASDGAAGDNFGFSVAFSGSTVVVGAIGHNFGQGAAYVFNRQGGSCVETQKLTATDGAIGDSFGNSVAVSGSTVVVGSPGDDIEKGSTYVFNRQRGSWVEAQKLTASDGAALDIFGYSVAISGSRVVVGAIGDNVFQGSAYVFNRQGESWVEEQKLTASDPMFFDQFGWSVAISGSTVVVGVPFGIRGGRDHGAAYVFNRQGADWVEEQKLTASDALFDFFGISVAVSGSTLIVGAENSGNIRQGSAYIFER